MPLPPQVDYVFHVYVDPTFGDNAQAMASNPGTAPNQFPLSKHPSFLTPGPVPPSDRWIGGLLQHAPYSFKTLSGTGGALDYIRLVFPFTTGPNSTYPWKRQFPCPGDPDRFVKWLVIHCLPGMYGPDYLPGQSPGQSPLDPESGLPFNGEVVPSADNTAFIELMPFVSLQGTSALNTIFDARGHARAMLAFRANQLITHGWGEVFIDSVTVRGARSEGSQPEDSGALRNISGAGIFIGDYLIGTPTISNCFVTDNVIGIAVADNPSDDTQPFPFGIARPRIINNTIAWNTVGLWCGNLHVGYGFPFGTNQSYSWPVVHNNVFDSGIPTPPYTDLPRLSGFEGLHPNDVTVATRTTTVLGIPVPIGISFNAWEVTTAPVSVNTGLTVLNGLGLPTNWPSTAPRGGGNPPLPAPRVNLAPFTNPTSTLVRGSLYVNDILRNSGFGPPATSFRGLSPHDFRLVLQVSNNPLIAPGSLPTPILQPLLNQGLWLSPSYTAITMANNEVIDRTTQRVGLPAGADYGGAVYHAWDLDAEGFGNPRVHQKSGFGIPGLPADPEGLDIDLGADEVGELIMAGYINGTTIFSVELTWPFPLPAGCIGAPIYTEHTQVRFFDFPGASDGARPTSNLIEGRTYTWWEHVLCRPDAVGGTAPFNNYTAGVPLSTRESLNVVGFIPDFMRNLHCDHAPHLLQDVRPIGVLPPFDQSPAPIDIYCSLPAYQSLNGAFRDNPYLYHNPQYTGSDQHDTWIQNPPPPALPGSGFPPTSWISSATLHPPATTNASPGAYLYLDDNIYVFGPFVFGPYGNCSGSSLAFGPWGFNDVPAGCPDHIPYFQEFDLQGLRFNCERNGSNLQSFLVISGSGIQEASSGGFKAKSQPPAGTEIEEIAAKSGGSLNQAVRSWLSTRGK